VLVTVGPWRPINLHTYASTITDLRVVSAVAEDLSVTVDVTFAVSSSAHVLTTIVSLLEPGGAAITPASSNPEDGPHVRFAFTPGEVELWYPVGYGKQPLYTVIVTTHDQVCVAS
jgi:beta-mannosidase